MQAAPTGTGAPVVDGSTASTDPNDPKYRAANALATVGIASFCVGCALGLAGLVGAAGAGASWGMPVGLTGLGLIIAGPLIASGIPACFDLPTPPAKPINTTSDGIYVGRNRATFAPASDALPLIAIVPVSSTGPVNV